MLVTFFCESCQAKLRINADAMGRTLRCPECETSFNVPMMTLGPGFVVGGFLIKYKLGEGGMGEVYLARQLSLERDVALKILPGRFTCETSFVVRFLKEVHYQASMDHPNIVTAYDAGEDNGTYYMAMAYVDGETLEEKLDRQGTLPESAALTVVKQIAEALKYASGEKGILHRDIKPANIMVTPSLHAKVLDMGLSKNTLEKKSSTLADTIMGTPNYMSPEQIDHPQNIDTRSDLFSLGMTLYHMLTGRVPFEDSSYLNTLKRHSQEKLEDPRELIPGISRRCTCILARMLARDPDDRYMDWDAFLKDVEGVITNKILPALPDGDTTLELRPEPEASRPAAAPETTNPQRSKRQLSPAGVGVSVALGLVLGLLGVRLVRPVPVQNDPVPAPIPSPPASEREVQNPLPTDELVDPEADYFDLRQELTRLVLDYERQRANYEQVIQDLVYLGIRAEGTPVSAAAVEQVGRVRRDRDAAVERNLREIREQALNLLYEDGAEAAREFLETYDSPFREELEPQVENLHQRIRIWELQERSQREEETLAAQQQLREFTEQLASPLLERDWPEILTRVDAASENPDFFPVAEDITDLRRQLIELRAVPRRILDTFEEELLQEIELRLQDRIVYVQVREVLPEGLLVTRQVYGEDGIPRGSAELFISLASISREEIIRRLEAHDIPRRDLYLALGAYRRGDRDQARRYLRRDDEFLARTLHDSWVPASEEVPRSLPQPETSDPFRPADNSTLLIP